MYIYIYIHTHTHIYIYIYIYVYIYIHIYIYIGAGHTDSATSPREYKRSLNATCSRNRTKQLPAHEHSSTYMRGMLRGGGVRGAAALGLYTILPSPILYGVWHTKRGPVEGRILRNDRAILLQ